MRKIINFSIMFALSLAFTTNLQAASFEPEKTTVKVFNKDSVPGVLKEWISWAMDSQEEKDDCNIYYNSAKIKHCYYISKLNLNLDNKELRFKQTVKVLKKGYVLLPGLVEAFFPSKVTANGEAKNVMAKAGRPYIFLDKGEYAIEGYAKSKFVPSSLSIPNDATILNLTKNGKDIPNPTVDNNGTLRLETQSTTKSETDDLSVFVYRKITDGVPVGMTVRLSLNVTGKERVENLGKIIPQNFSLMGIRGSTSAYIQTNGDLIVEARPGSSNIDIELHQNKDSLEFTLDNSPVEQEVWVFESDNSRRVIQAPDTLQSVQTQNIPMPEAWKSLPAYEVKKTDAFVVKAINFDNKNLDNLNLYRNVKLAFDGSFYSIEDRVNANFKQDGRLTIGEPFSFYSSNINGEPQAITYTSEDKDAGIEVRKGNVNITNILRVENKNAPIPATGYNREFNDSSWNLQLAPGYKLFHASGVDTVSQSWISDWDLMSVFIVALLTVTMFYLLGIGRAAIGLVLIVLLHPIFPQFTYITFILCGLLFLQRNISDLSNMYKFVIFFRYSLTFFLLIASFVFAIKHLREAIYPILDNGSQSIFMSIISSNFLFTFYLYSAVFYIFYLIVTASYPLWKKFVYSVGLFFSVMILSSIIVVIINGIPLMGAASMAYHETFGGPMYAQESLAYDEVEMMQVASPKKVRLMKKELAVMNNFGVDKKAELGKYQSLNVARNVAQTGVGFPEWKSNNYRSSGITLYLKGPVSERDTFRLYLVTPFVNTILSFIRVLLGIMLLYWLVDHKRTPVNLGKKGKDIMKRLFAAAVFSLMLLNPLSANAMEKAIEEVPSKEIIKELGDKLNREYLPSCLPDCVSIPNGKISNEGNNVKVNIYIHSNAKLVVPLPQLRADGSGYAKLESILLNGQDTKNTVKKDGSVFILVNKGINNVEMQYLLDENTDRFLINAPIRITYMEENLDGLSLNEASSANQNFQINRVKKVVREKKTSELSKMDIDTFYTIERRFDIGTLWQVTTVVSRDNNISEASSIEIPLMVGEKVLSSEGTLLKDKIRISFSPQESQKEFSSLLPVEQNIKLVSPEVITNYREIWAFNVDYAWSFKYKNMVPAVVNDNSLVFQPRAHDALDFQIFRPESVDGYVITFDRVDYTLSPGRGVLEATIKLELRASDTGVHDITVPDNTEIKDLNIGGRQYPITLNGNKLSVPVIQGRNNIQFVASIKEELGNVLRFPEFNLNAPAVNVSQTALVPLKKWVLFTCGPVKGPVVLFWSMIPALMIIAFLLSRVKACPLGFWQWFILFLGLTQSGFSFMIVIITWFISMGIKDKFSDKLKFKRFIQLCLALLTILFVYSLFRGVYNGLLGSWSMRIVGEGSYVTSNFLRLAWYQDSVMGQLPSPKVISLPVWVYRCVMILWSTWLAVYFVKWVKWGFQSFMKD